MQDGAGATAAMGSARHDDFLNQAAPGAAGPVDAGRVAARGCLSERSRDAARMPIKLAPSARMRGSAVLANDVYDQDVDDRGTERFPRHLEERIPEHIHVVRLREGAAETAGVGVIEQHLEKHVAELRL